MFVVFEAKGFQYLGSPGERLRIPRLDSKIGEKVTFDKVLLVKNGDTKIGKPYIEGASITAEIVEHGRYKKIIVFKFKKRKRYKRTKGHRQTYTEIEIKDILLGGKKTEKKEAESQKKTEAEKKTSAEDKTKKVKAAKKAAKPEKTTAKKKKSSKTASKSKKTAAESKKKTKKTVSKKKTTTSKSKKASSKAKKIKKTTGKTKKDKK